MKNLDQLRAEHAELLAIASEIRHLLDPSAIGKKVAKLQELMAELVRCTLAHILVEDSCIYQEMLFSEHDETRGLAQKHFTALGDISSDLGEYVRNWQASRRIISEPELFCMETRHILHLLEARINQEEQLLYPALEA